MFNMMWLMLYFDVSKNSFITVFNRFFFLSSLSSFLSFPFICIYFCFEVVHSLPFLCSLYVLVLVLILMFIRSPTSSTLSIPSIFKKTKQKYYIYERLSSSLLSYRISSYPIVYIYIYHIIAQHTSHTMESNQMSKALSSHSMIIYISLLSLLILQQRGVFSLFIQ